MASSRVSLPDMGAGVDGLGADGLGNNLAGLGGLLGLLGGLEEFALRTHLP